MAEYRTGYQSIFHDDGSVTQVSVEREYPVEPLSTKAQVLWTVGTLVVSALCVAAPIGITTLADRRGVKNRLKDRQHKNKEIFQQLNAI